MRLRHAWAMLLLGALAPAWARAQDTAPTAQPAASPAGAATSAAGTAAPSASPQRTWQPDNRLTLGVDGAALTGTNGGGGGSIGYLLELNPDTLLGIGTEYQTLANAHWVFGSLSAAFSHALTTTTRWSLSAEGHEGYGTSGTHRFGYSIAALGGGLTLPAGFAVTAEERQIDVDTSHGSLPKVGVSRAWGTHWLTAVAYARSVGGNLGTEYSLARIDFYGRGFDLLGGGSVGRVAPAVLDINGVLLAQAKPLTEVFFGVTKPLARVDLTLLGDQIDLSGIKRTTVTLTATVHFR